MRKLATHHFEEGSSTFQFIQQTFAVQIRKKKRQEQFKQRRRQRIHNSSQSNLKKIISATVGKGEDLKEKELLNIIGPFYNIQFENNMLEMLAQLLDSNSLIEVYKGLTGIRMLLWDKNPSTYQILKLRIDDKILRFAKMEEQKLIRFLSVWCLTNMTFQDISLCQNLFNKGIIPILFDCLSCKDIETIQQAVWCIGNLSKTGQNVIRCLLDGDAISKLVEIIMAYDNQQLVDQTCWAIATICIGCPSHHYDDIEKGIIILCSMIGNDCIKELDSLVTSIIAISTHCQFTQTRNKGKIISETSLFPKVVTYLASQKIMLINAVLRLSGNFATGDSQVCQILLQSNILQYLKALLSHSFSNIRCEACWVISNLTAGECEQVKVIISNEQLMSKLSQMLVSDLPGIRKQIIFIYANMISVCPPGQIQKYFVKTDIIRQIFQLIKLYDQKLTQSALKNLNRILKYAKFKRILQPLIEQIWNCQGVQILQDLQVYGTDNEYKIVSKIIKNYFLMSDQAKLI